MEGIISYGAYIPKYRLDRDIMAKAWGTKYIGGERAVANHDEDSITMAVEAGTNCISRMDAHEIDGLLYASSTSPYQESQASSILSTALDMSKEIFTADYLSSVRSGTAALKAAWDSVKGSRNQNIIVAASDSRKGKPGSDSEQLFGDGSAAVIIGKSRVAACLEGFYSLSEEFMDSWRTQDDIYVRKGDTAFSQTYGYLRIVENCIKGFLKKYDLEISDISRFVISAPDNRIYSRLVKNLGLISGSYMEDPLLNWVGDSGAASPIMLLVSELEKARENERILLCSYGSGSSDCILFRTTAEIERLRNQRGVSYYRRWKKALNNYEKFLKFQNTLPVEPLSPYSSWALLWKERKQNIGLYGTRCKKCGSYSYPRRRVCLRCNSKDEYEDVKLSKKGRIYTFAKDYLFPSLDPPTVMAVADMDGGGRFYGQMTDCDINMVKIGMLVELSFRRFHQGEGFINYFWKLRPLE